MNYAWEAALAADEAGIEREELRFVPVRNGSPYMEVASKTINTSELNRKEVEINPLYRYANVFSGLFDVNLEGFKETRMLFIDVCLHCYVQVDLRQGLSKQEYALRFLLKDMLDGVCASQAANVVQQFDKGKLRRILRFIRKLYHCGSSLCLFKEVMRCMYPDSLVYASNDAVRQILIYVGIKETKTERERLEFLQDTFLPINYQVFLFWDRHFGIMDVDETMVLDEMVLF